jgi:orotidine-5'-phosphate decarboxylase
VAARESQIVLGLDPHPAALWPAAGAASGRLPASSPADVSSPADSSSPAGESAADIAARAVFGHCRALIDAVAPACVAVKLQLACFERLGPPGAAALAAVALHARSLGLLVIADGKRGDIDVTAVAYAEALFGGLPTSSGVLPGLGADMVTVNPLMGRDAVEPFVAAARAARAGVLVLVRTSNPGAAYVLDLELAGGGAVWERLAGLVRDLGRAGVGEAGLSDLGAVVGATAPQHLARARELMPNAIFLLPGIGAQGGRVEDLAPAFAPGRAGGLIAASRSIAGAHLVAGGEPAAAARAEAERLRAAAWSVSA